MQKNEIDLNALQLMSEKEFNEIGLPAVCTKIHDIAVVVSHFTIACLVLYRVPLTSC